MGVIDSLSGLGATGSTAAVNKGSFGASKDQFLKLLLAQMKNQDPLAAPDADKMAEQITQFGQLEQLMNLNQTMTDMAQGQATNLQGQAVSLIGKTIQVQGEGVDVVGANRGSIGFHISQPASEVQVDVYDRQGRKVRTLTYNNVHEGATFKEFDGRNDAGEALPDGTYTTLISGTTVNGFTLQGTPLVRGQVDTVEFVGGNPVVRMGGKSYGMNQIIAVNG